MKRAIGALLGLAMGDALGASLELKVDKTYQPVTDMVGGGPFYLQAGEWTDDTAMMQWTDGTAMMLCLADSLMEKGRIDLRDQIEAYVRWYRHGENSCTGNCVDIEVTVSDALSRYEANGVPEAGSCLPNTADKGSLMRIAPIALFFARNTESVAMKAARLSSITTHAEPRCIQACELMTLLLHRILNTESLASKEAFLAEGLSDYLKLRPDCHPDIRLIATGAFIEKSQDELQATGYVIASLEAALWCFIHSENFEQGALLAANLGEGTDTSAAIFGQLAGAFYGSTTLPSKWTRLLAWAPHIEQTALWLIQRPSNKNIRGFIANTRACLEQKDNRRFLYSLAYKYNLVPNQINYQAPFSADVVLNTPKDLAIWLDKASLRDCLCWLMSLVRKERFFDGIIEACIRAGNVDLWLKRVETLVVAD